MSLRQENSSYEASDESSENELLDRSLSLWRGWVAIDDDDDDFAPCPLDLHTASSIGHYECVRTIIARWDSCFFVCFFFFLTMHFQCYNTGNSQYY